MKNAFIIIALLGLFSACKKDKMPPADPAASFTFSNSAANELRLATTDTTMLISTVSNATAISWDLGDGRKVTDSKLVLAYAKSGVYTVTLTATADNGKQVTVTKKVTVLDRVLKSIIISNVYWNNTDPQFAQAGWPLTNTADVYVKIQQLQGNDVFTGGFAPNAPVVYTSPVLKNVSSTTTTPLGITVTPKVVFDKPVFNNGKYLISLIAKNTTGEYVLFSTLYSGSEQFIKTESLAKNTFVVHTSFFCAMDLNFDFE